MNGWVRRLLAALVCCAVLFGSTLALSEEAIVAEEPFEGEVLDAGAVVIEEIETGYDDEAPDAVVEEEVPIAVEEEPVEAADVVEVVDAPDAAGAEAPEETEVTLAEALDLEEAPVEEPNAAEGAAAEKSARGDDDFEIDDEGVLVNYYGDGGDVVIPDGVTAIGDWAFSYCTGLTSVIIPDGVTAIGYSAFEGCSDLVSVSIPDSVTEIAEWAFSNCASLTSITIPGGVNAIEDWTFYWCTGLESVTIADGVTAIGNEAFYACESLTSVNIPGSVAEIGEWAFQNCTSLASVAIADGVTAIGDWAFSNCTSLTSITIPGSVTEIGYCAFFDCTGLESVTISDGVTIIGDAAFSDCTSLTNVSIPDSVTEIWGDAFAGCESLESITIPNSVTTIEDYTFAYCSNLTSITIPESVTTIGEYVFSDCSGLTSVTIPQGITRIESGTFDACKALKDVYYAGTKAEAKQISIGSYNHYLQGAVWHCSDGTFTPIPIYKLTKASASRTIYMGEKLRLNLNGAKVKSVKSSNTKIATVAKSSAPVITAKKAGKATITVTLTTGKKRVLTATVKDPTMPKSVSLDVTKATMYLGNGTQTLVATMAPTKTGATAKSGLTWKSSNTKIVKVGKTSGILTAVKAGTAKVTVTTDRGKKTATCTVTVRDPNMPKAITLDQTSVKLLAGEVKNFQLNADLDWWVDELAVDKNEKVTWTSSDKAVAKVSSTGLVTPLKSGKATITAKTANGKKATCAVTIYRNKLDNIHAKPTAKQIKSAGKTYSKAYLKSVEIVNQNKVVTVWYAMNGSSKVYKKTQALFLGVRLKGAEEEEPGEYGEDYGETGGDDVEYDDEEEDANLIAQAEYNRLAVNIPANSYKTITITHTGSRIGNSGIDLRKLTAADIEYWWDDAGE